MLFTVTAILGTPAGTTAGSATFFASGGGVPIEDTTDGFTATVVPEPASLLLLGSGLLTAPVYCGAGAASALPDQAPREPFARGLRLFS